MPKTDLILCRKNAVTLASHLASNYKDWSFDVVRIELDRKELDDVEKSRRVAKLLTDVWNNKEIEDVDQPNSTLALPQEMMEKIRVIAPSPWDRAAMIDSEETEPFALWSVEARLEKQVVTMFTYDRSPTWLRRYQKGKPHE